MSKLLDAIRAGDVRVGDGAMGTMLQSAGLDDGGAPELWNVERADEIERILTSYADAGAQLLTTNTFGEVGLGCRCTDWKIEFTS